MSPEPDLVASTKSSSGSDKSNSLPRAGQEPPSEPSRDASSSPSRLPVLPSAAAHNQPIDNQALFVRGNIPLAIHPPSLVVQDQQFAPSFQHPTGSPIPASGVPGTVVVPIAPPPKEEEK